MSHASSRRRRRLTRVVLAGVAIAAITGCGSTVRDAVAGRTADEAAAVGATDPGATDLSGTSPASPGQASQATAGASSAMATPPRASGQAGPASQPSVAGQSAAESSTSNVAPGGSGTAGAAGATAPTGPEGSPAPPAASSPPAVATPSGRGVSEDTFTVGATVIRGYESTANSLGLQGSSLGDQQAQVEAVLDHINQHGGIAGRTAHAAFVELDATSGADPSTQQARCAAFTEDLEVFAVIETTNTQDALLACLAGHGTPFLGQGAGLYGQDLYEQYPGLLYQPAFLNAHRAAGAYVDGLAQAGFFDDGARIGLLVADHPTYVNARDEVLAPRLAAHGLEIAEEVHITDTDLGQTSAQSSSAVLRFRASGITHVLVLDSGAAIGYTFMLAAEGQAYRPRYGLTSVSGPSFLQLNVPAAQLARAMGVGWLPLLDVAAAQEPPPNTTRTLCSSIFADASISFADRIAESSGLYFCELLLFIQAGMDIAPSATVEGFDAAVDHLGITYQTATGLATRLDPTHHDGAAAASLLSFNDTCSCFEYLGDAFTVN